MRKTAISSGVIGLVLLIAAALMAWWITPSYIARMPSSYNTTRTYDATIPHPVQPGSAGDRQPGRRHQDRPARDDLRDRQGAADVG